MVSIVIVGGGTAGWITANVLLRRLDRDRRQQVKVTVVESKRIGILGVGEATVPTIRNLLRFLGVPEQDFMQATSATFKHGILYRDWAREPDPQGNRHRYFHPFEHTKVADFNPTLWWLSTRAHEPEAQYADEVCPQPRVAVAGKAPRNPDMPQYEGLLGYAYHLDAERLAEYLAELAIRRGVTRIIDDVVSVSPRAGGGVSAIDTRERGHITGDFFIDCTGFVGLLLNKALGVGFVDFGDVLFCDRAVAIRVPTGESEDIRPYTTTTAKDAGWVWDIDLQTRRGTGYVYSSRHASAEHAEAELRRHVGPAAEKLDARHLKMRVGHSREFWRANVAAIGLSGGFIEPLESTGIYLIEVGALRLAEALEAVLGVAFEPNGAAGEAGSAVLLASAIEPLARLYNARMIALYAEIRDFIKVHYSLSGRRSTAFWRDNADSDSFSAGLRELMERWSLRPPQSMDFPDRFGLFNEHNWLCVMLGMGWAPRHPEALRRYISAQTGDRFMALIAATAEKAAEALPDHRKYFERLSQERREPELTAAL